MSLEIVKRDVAGIDDHDLQAAVGLRHGSSVPFIGVHGRLIGTPSGDLK
jgi:hypothetical protein